MAGYQYQGSGRDELTAFMDRPLPAKRPRMHNNKCRRCKHCYNTRYHQEVCRPSYLAQPKRPNNKNYCVRCGKLYKSRAHKESCKTGISNQT